MKLMTGRNLISTFSCGQHGEIFLAAISSVFASRKPLPVWSKILFVKCCFNFRSSHSSERRKQLTFWCVLPKNSKLGLSRTKSSKVSTKIKNLDFVSFFITLKLVDFLNLGIYTFPRVEDKVLWSLRHFFSKFGVTMFYIPQIYEFQRRNQKWKSLQGGPIISD